MALMQILQQVCVLKPVQLRLLPKLPIIPVFQIAQTAHLLMKPHTPALILAQLALLATKMFARVLVKVAILKTQQHIYVKNAMIPVKNVMEILQIIVQNVILINIIYKVNHNA